MTIGETMNPAAQRMRSDVQDGRTFRAAVYRGDPRLEIADATLPAPPAGMVLVKMGASGICGSDRHVLDGDWTMPEPTVLGHEGAGVVEAVGDGVNELAAGDHVILTWFYPCESCAACREGRSWVCTGSKSEACLLPDGTTVLEVEGEQAYPYLAVGSMAEYAIVPRQAAIRVPDDVPFDVAALIGCSVATGVGAVVNDAEVKPGRSAVVVGAGGVGLCVVMGLKLAGATPIIAIDANPEALELARKFGATNLILANEDVVADVHAITDGGADYAFEAIGRVPTIEMLPTLLRRGGAAVAVGLPPEGSPAAIDVLALAESGQRFIGSNYGSTVPARDFPMLARLYAAGMLPIDELITNRVTLDDVNEGFEMMRKGSRGRSVVVFDEPPAGS